MSIFGPPKERKTQLFFRDDNRFHFVKRELKYSSLIEVKNTVMLNGWPQFYSNQFYFGGYKNIPADSVTLGYSRDIILDPFDKIPKGSAANEKPKPKDSLSLKNWIARVATNQRQTYQVQRKNALKEDAVNYALIAVLVIMIFGWIIRFVSLAGNG